MGDILKNLLNWSSDVIQKIQDGTLKKRKIIEKMLKNRKKLYLKISEKFLQEHNDNT